MKICTSNVMSLIQRRAKAGYCLIIPVLLAAQLSAAGHQQTTSDPVLKETIDCTIERKSLKEALAIVQKKSGYLFIYNEKLLSPYTAVSVDAKHQSVADVISTLLRNLPLTYNIRNGKVIIMEKAGAKRPQTANDISGNEEKVKGKITDENGVPLPGVTILIKGSNKGAISDGNGNFFVTVNDDETLVFSMSGYKSRELSVEKEMKVTLTTDIRGLNEMVVVGYGAQKKSDVTGAVASVKAKDIAEQPVSSPIEALKGKVAGLDIANSGNEPGAGASIVLRGQRSIYAGNSPLIVLDGIPLASTDPINSPNVNLNEINPNDIASIEVLKDASSTAIYGSRAANGVILITTKRGTAGQTNVSYDAYYGTTRITRKLDVMDGQQFAQLRREAARTNDPNNAYPADATLFDDIALKSLATGRSTDWQDLVYQAGSKQNHQVSVTGGKERTQFAVSFNYYRENGVVEKADYSRGSLRINLDHQVSKSLRFGVYSFLTRSAENTVSNDVFDNMLRNNPLGVAYDSLGNLLFRPNNDEGQRVNPLMDIKNYTDQTYKTRIFSSLYGEWDITKGLSYRLNVGPEIENDRNGAFAGSQTTTNQGGTPAASVSDRELTSVTIENILKYDRMFGKDHHLNVTLLQSSQQQELSSTSTTANQLPYETQSYHNLSSAGQVLGITSDYQRSLLLSYMGRINYDFKGRYLLTLTARKDGSSVFAAGHKWESFPSAALAWRIDAEPFMQRVTPVSALKLRLSYGKTGNNGIPPYGTFSILAPNPYGFGNTGASGFIPSTISNPDLKWETTREFNAGVDFSLFKDRISGAVEHYIANTANLLLTRGIPGSTGYTKVLQNIGATRNKGWEITLSTVNIRTRSGFQWRTDFNFATNRNNIIRLYGDGRDDIGNGWFIGEAITSIYSYKKIGIWQTNEKDQAATYGYKPGMIKLQDINNDKVLDDKDRTILGSRTPSWTGGITNRFSYKGLELTTVINTRQHYLTISQFYNNNNRLAGRYNNLDVDYWTPENPTNENPRPDKNQESVFMGNTLQYRDASFVRIKNLSLSFTLPARMLRGAGLKNLRLSLSAENPFTFTSYKGQDPEFESDGTRAMYPAVKMYAIGLNASF
ncbi:TonB-linked outer membrane protein, SusC/RagA family [Chitinophaga sp. YR627]|uniref:TonB-dependent receptor n=1 Tax=Chitinophaga sp. YR627 TaxID=1881041 RepID=UPI0008EC8B4D|nr:TonB-dependent receptor [Chitinophaga sp. YR627]SFM91853.1 TonB-linked outer membrane protein, SusC/RagA family [Chitinophaga sp. YR627]